MFAMVEVLVVVVVVADAVRWTLDDERIRLTRRDLREPQIGERKMAAIRF